MATLLIILKTFLCCVLLLEGLGKREIACASTWKAQADLVTSQLSNTGMCARLYTLSSGRGVRSGLYAVAPKTDPLRHTGWRLMSANIMVVKKGVSPSELIFLMTRSVVMAADRVRFSWLQCGSIRSCAHAKSFAANNWETRRVLFGSQQKARQWMNETLHSSLKTV